MATDIKTLKDLYVDVLRDLYSAEQQITKALPKIIKRVTSPELRMGLEEHLHQTENHVTRLDQIFDKMGASSRGKKCVGMEGILAEGGEAMNEKMASPDLMDAAIIGACQKVEHYEMSGYGTARSFAQMIGEQNAVGLLEQTLEEEKAADKKLTQVAMNVVNLDALSTQPTSSGTSSVRRVR